VTRRGGATALRRPPSRRCLSRTRLPRTAGVDDPERSKILTLASSRYGPNATRHTPSPERDRVGDPNDATRQG
jgi:hypothetical protein